MQDGLLYRLQSTCSCLSGGITASWTDHSNHGLAVDFKPAVNPLAVFCPLPGPPRTLEFIKSCRSAAVTRLH